MTGNVSVPLNIVRMYFPSSVPILNYLPVLPFSMAQLHMHAKTTLSFNIIPSWLIRNCILPETHIDHGMTRDCDFEFTPARTKRTWTRTLCKFNLHVTAILSVRESFTWVNICIHVVVNNRCNFTLNQSWQIYYTYIYTQYIWRHKVSKTWLHANAYFIN